MLEALGLEVWWPAMRAAVDAWKTPLQPIVASKPMERWQIDFTGPYEYDEEKGGELKKRKKMALLVVDAASKMLWGDVFSSKKCVKVANFIELRIKEEGAPSIIQADNGGEFIGPELKDVYARVILEEVHSAPHHPQTNGQIERVRQELREILATKNTLRHKTTGCIPIEIHRGRLLHRPTDMTRRQRRSCRFVGFAITV